MKRTIMNSILQIVAGGSPAIQNKQTAEDTVPLHGGRLFHLPSSDCVNE